MLKVNYKTVSFDGSIISGAPRKVDSGSKYLLTQVHSNLIATSVEYVSVDVTRMKI